MLLGLVKVRFVDKIGILEMFLYFDVSFKLN